ncbi:hypothetical protein MKW98_028608, partial [Papaver atlanticum]
RFPGSYRNWESPCFRFRNWWNAHQLDIPHELASAASLCREFIRGMWTTDRISAPGCLGGKMAIESETSSDSLPNPLPLTDYGLLGSNLGDPHAEGEHARARRPPSVLDLDAGIEQCVPASLILALPTYESDYNRLLSTVSEHYGQFMNLMVQLAFLCV